MKTNLLSKIKPKLCTTAVLVIALTSIAGGTLAYFTADEVAHNVITSGGVDIEILEWQDEAKTEPFADIDGVLPGAEITKIAEIKNTGESEAWIRVQIKKSFSNVEEADLSLIVLDIDNTNWTEKGGWYYYNEKVAPGETTKPIFQTVQFDKQMDNKYQNTTAMVDVYAQAVQVANNGTTVMDANGWPAEE